MADINSLNIFGATYNLFAKESLTFTGAISASYNGSTAVTVTLGSASVTAVSVSTITASIPTSGYDSAIPTVAAIRGYASTGTLSNPLIITGMSFDGSVTKTILLGSGLTASTSGNTTTISLVSGLATASYNASTGVLTFTPLS